MATAFKKLVQKLKGKGTKDPKALAAWIGRKKHGKAKFQEAAKRGVQVKNLKKSIERARSVLDERQDLRKGCHDAMHHHALHAEAARKASYSSGVDAETSKKLREAAKKHEFMLARHALEDAKKKRGGMPLRSSLSDAMNHYTTSAGEHIGYDDDHPLVSDKKKKAAYVPHEDDTFDEEYSEGGEPEVK